MSIPKDEHEFREIGTVTRHRLKSDTLLIYYSLASFPGEPHATQWLRSVESLRLYNRQVPIHLFVFGTLSPTLQAAADRYQVILHLRPSYVEYLRELIPDRALPLSYNPRLHKLLVLSEFDNRSLAQILYLDCDTYCLGDVASLFHKYQACHWYARRDHDLLGDKDQATIDRLAREEGVRSTPIYNTGVFILNHAVWRDLALLRSKFLSYTWRLLVGLHVNTIKPNDLQNELDKLVALTMNKEDVRTRLDISSRYGWVLGQLSCGLMLGGMLEISHDGLLQSDVAQGLEFAELPLSGPQPIVVHYFTKWERTFCEWLQQRRYRPMTSHVFRRRL